MFKSKGIISIPAPTVALGLALLLLLPFTTTALVVTTRTTPPSIFSSTSSSSVPVPEVSPQRLEQVSNWVSSSLGDTATCSNSGGEDNSDDDGPVLNSSSSSTAKEEEKEEEDDTSATKLLKDGRYAMARKAALEWETSSQMESYELVYGELSLPVLTTILDAVGVYPGDRFLDVGSGDGALVLGASLLYAEDDDDGDDGGDDGDDDDDDDESKNAIAIARGLEIVPGLYKRSLQHEDKLASILKDDGAQLLRKQQSPVEFHLGDIHKAFTDSTVTQILEDSTLVVCFATTWSAGNAQRDQASNSLQGRKLPFLSKALEGLPQGARVVIVDGRLDSKDGHEWQGDLKIYCPDTAPWSIASLYHKR
ncbi:MAG: hypothetical protein SGBAC_000715 [Bacillariaceae sp.]